MTTVPVLRRSKKILLVVANLSSRNLRANVFRNLGIEVVCAAHVSDARELWHPSVYDLVLLGMCTHSEDSTVFCREMRQESPAQNIAWLVGGPEFLSHEPLPDRRLEESSATDDSLRQMLANACDALPHRGGFLEARWRMALKRSTRPGAATERSPRFEGMPEAQPINGRKSKSSFADAVLRAEAEQEGVS